MYYVGEINCFEDFCEFATNYYVVNEINKFKNPNLEIIFSYKNNIGDWIKGKTYTHKIKNNSIYSKEFYTNVLSIMKNFLDNKSIKENDLVIFKINFIDDSNNSIEINLKNYISFKFLKQSIYKYI